MLMIGVCVVALAAHMVLQPMRSKAEQSLQTLLLSCMSVVAVCSAAFAIALDAAAQTTAVPVLDFAAVVTLLFGIIVPSAAFGVTVAKKRTTPLALASVAAVLCQCHW
jgi:hypothetical protein